MSYDFDDFYVTSWGWDGPNRIWKVMLDVEGEYIEVGRFTGEGRGLDIEVARKTATDMIAAKMS